MVIGLFMIMMCLGTVRLQIILTLRCLLGGAEGRVVRGWLVGGCLAKSW